MSQSMKYTVEIFEPRSTEKVWTRLESDTPYPDVHEGDLLLLQPSWPKLEGIQHAVRVTGVELILSLANDGSRQWTKVYTESVDKPKGADLIAWIEKE